MTHPDTLHSSLAGGIRPTSPHKTRGVLRIFLGAAPGVGKTLAMLKAALTLKAEAIDVVVGVIEPHKQQEVEALLAQFEAIPRKKMQYQGMEFEEMDLDRLLERKPAVALIDELAHTNAPGSRHLKRYMDVEELLSSGIDVLTTLNIQHVESLNDVISRITKTHVKETVPNTVIDSAEDIALIDFSPKELQKRFQEGSIAIANHARQVASHMFTVPRLTALRELSLRFAAEQVDARLLHVLEKSGRAASIPTRERLMVCVDNDIGSLELVRHCSRMAVRQKLPWMTVYIDDPKERANKAGTDYVYQAMRLTEELGGQAVAIVGTKVVAEILQLARSRNVTRIVIGKPKRRWWEFYRSSVAKELLKHTGTFELLIVPTEDIVVLERKQMQESRIKKFSAMDYVVVVIAVGVALLFALIVEKFLPLVNIPLIFLLAVIYVAVRSGFLASFVAITLSFFAYVFLFAESGLSFMAMRQEHIVNLFFFTIVAAITSRLAGRLHQQVEMIREGAEQTANLYRFSQKVANARNLHSILSAVTEHVTSTLDTKAVVLLPSKAEKLLTIAAGFPDLNKQAMQAAEWAWKHKEATGHGCRTLPSSDWTFLPMETDKGIIGVLGIHREHEETYHAGEQKQLLAMLTHQAAVAIERAQLVEGMEEVRKGSNLG